MSRLNQRITALEGGGEALNIRDVMDLYGHEEDGHTVDWPAVWKAAVGVKQALDSLPPPEPEDDDQWAEERRREVEAERRSGLRKPGPVEPRLRRFVLSGW